MVQVEDVIETTVEQEIEEEVSVVIPDTFPEMLQCVSEGTSGDLWDRLIDDIAAYCIRREGEHRIRETLDGRDPS
jgi:hypothetical protein